MTEGVSQSHATRAAAIVDELEVSGSIRLATELLAEALGLITDDPDTLDLKIATAALAEMRDAYEMFKPYKAARKVSVFGSARTQPDDPGYEQARVLAAELAGRDWMTVTGAGPGIMQAAMEGAGVENSIGVSIRLPFESGANSIIAGDDKHVSMKYFFTRKLMLIKESQAFVCLPGGVGTLDETFELLTLTQTGKGVPVPIVLLDQPGTPYWGAIDDLMHLLVKRGLVSAADTSLYRIADTPEAACQIIDDFYRNYDSIRFVGDHLVMRLHEAPSDQLLADLNQRYRHLLESGDIERVEPFKAEVRDDDRLDLPRIAFHFTKHGYGDLIAMIGDLNDSVES